MRYSVRNRPLYALALIVLLLFIVIPLGLSAVNEDEDTVSVEGKSGKRGERVRIQINENGISIETDEGKKGVFKRGDVATIYIEGSDEHLREKATDIVRFGGDVFVAEDEMVRGDLVVFGGDVTVHGRVMGDIVVIGGDLIAYSGAVINGDAVVIGGTIEEDPDVSIHGDKVIMNSPFPFLGIRNFYGPRTRLWNLMGVPIRFMFCLFLTFLVLLFMKDRVLKSRSYLQFEFIKSFGWGLLICFAAVFIIPIIMCLLAITLIGIPLAVLVALSCVGISIIACAIFAHDLGTRVMEKLNIESTSAYVAVLIGIAILHLPILIGHGIALYPYMWQLGFAIRILGNILILFACATGIGAIFTSRFGSRERIGETPAAPTAPPTVPATE